MHKTAMFHGELFLRAYADLKEYPTIVDIGSMDVNGSIRYGIPNSNYIGLDFEPGKGVERIIQDPYNLPVEDNTADFIVSSTTLEHAEFFWLTFLEGLRILKDDGIMYINVPSNGSFHRYPLDCWRFFPDAGTALSNWGKRNGYNCALVESFIGPTDSGNQSGWNDYIAVFIKNKEYINMFPNRMVHQIPEALNITLYEIPELQKFSHMVMKMDSTV